jgi:hypothetical protein
MDQKVKVPYVSYKYVIKNNGPAVAQNIRLTPHYDEEALTPKLREVSKGSKVSRKGEWSVEELYPGKSVEMLWSFEINKFGKTLDLATYSAFSMVQEDSDLTKDVQKSKIEVSNVAKLKVKKTLSRKDIYEGESYEMYIDVKNVGSQISRKIEIYDHVDESHLKTIGKPSVSKGRIKGGVWRIEELRADEKARLTVPVKFIKEIKENYKYSDPIESITMEQESYYNLDKFKAFEYKVKNIQRALSSEGGEND